MATERDQTGGTDPPALPSETLWKVVERSSEGVIVADDQGRIVYVNPTGCRSLRYDAHELVGRPVLDIIYSDDREAVLGRLAAASRDGVSGARQERHLLRKDGTLMLGEGLSIRTVLGGRPALVLIGRDQTNTRQTERDFQSLVEGHPGLVAVHAGGRLLYINPAGVRMLGYARPAELVGRSVLELIPESERRWIGERLNARVPVGEFKTPRLVKGLRADGQVRTFEVAILATHFEGRPADLVVGHDETDRLEAEERLAHSAAALQRAEAMSAVGKLVSAVAHEVRNPLFAITSTLDSLLAALPEDPFARQCAGVLRSEASRLTDLMRDLLEYGKPREPRFVVDALDDVVERVVACGADAARAREVRVVHRPDQGLPRVRMDPGRMMQVFQNLVDNAVRHAPPGTDVAVIGAASPGGESVVYRVQDRGPGFREEDLPRIFEPFFSRRYGGTGLGLSIVQRICEEHGGTAEVGNGPEGGAVVTVRFPAHREEVRSA